MQRIARTQGALILLDGLDECGNSASRERVLEGVRELMRTAGPRCRFVLTARPYAWPSGPDPVRGVYALADLDDAQIEQFIHGWYAALVERKWRSPGEAERKVGDLLAARHRPDLLPLARNPLLLTLMATLHTNRGRLPDDRADLYNESVDLLLLRWNRQIGADKALLDELAIPSLKLSDLREVLEDLAFKVHEQNVGKKGTADIGEDRLVRAFRPLLNNSKDKADVVVDYIEKRAGLLIGQGEKDGERQFTFPHRTVQLQEIGLGAINKRERTRSIAARVADWLAESLPVHPDDGGASAAQRAQAGDVLTALGDPRFNPDRFHLPADDMLGFVRIPADREFRIGTREADARRVAGIIGAAVPDDEVNDSLTPTPEFYIASYPVTVAQFRAFVEARKLKIGDADALRDPDSRPVRWVSWHEARAYCEWLNETLGTSPVFEGIAVARLVREGLWRVALPSELEWEKAARGGLPDAIFSWGDTPDPNRANYADSGIGDTSTGGCFPANGFSLHDTIGNVWEWTRSLWVDYPYKPDDPDPEDLDAGDDESRVVRGGSWHNYHVNARCAFRFWLPPDLRNDVLGFRVVLRSTHVLPVLLVVPPQGGAARRYTRAARSGNAGRSAQAGLPAEAKEEEQHEWGVTPKVVPPNEWEVTRFTDAGSPPLPCAGGACFFTVNLLKRQADLPVRHIEALRSAVKRTRAERPFHAIRAA